jgi:YggT family protein
VNDQVAAIFSLFLYLLIIAVVLRSLMSWFPVDRNNPAARLLVQVTEPLLEPVRRFMPRIGIIDISAMVVIFVLFLMLRVVDRASS